MANILKQLVGLLKPFESVLRIVGIVGMLAWGLVGLFNYNIVTSLLGMFGTTVGGFAPVVYVLVGIAGVYEILKGMEK